MCSRRTGNFSPLSRGNISAIAISNLLKEDTFLTISVPSIGATSLQSSQYRHCNQFSKNFSPLNRGNISAIKAVSSMMKVLKNFSPLNRGNIAAMKQAIRRAKAKTQFQSPQSGQHRCNAASIQMKVPFSCQYFSPLNRGNIAAINPYSRSMNCARRISVPSIGATSLQCETCGIGTSHEINFSPLNRGNIAAIYVMCVACGRGVLFQSPQSGQHRCNQRPPSRT